MIRSRMLYLSGTAGPLCAVYRPPVGRWQKGVVLHVPAFAEEMNKSRRMVAVQADRLADTGYSVLVVDLYGTGDSAGDFGEARWGIWKRDLEIAIEWALANQGGTVTLWGLRLGCLLALDVADKHADSIDRMIFWQPITEGRMMMRQFLRLRVAAGMMGRGQRETVKDLWSMLESGDALEIAGYMLAPELARAIDARSFENLSPPAKVSIDWLEVVASRERGMTATARRAIDEWVGRGHAVSAIPVVGDAFWSTQEIALAPALLDETTRRLSVQSKWRAGSSKPIAPNASEAAFTSGSGQQ